MAFPVRGLARPRHARAFTPRAWVSLSVAVAIALGLGCALGGGDGGGADVEPIGSAPRAFVSDTAPLACPTHATPAIPGGLLPPTPAGADVPGSIEGAFDVNDAGAAVYALRTSGRLPSRTARPPPGARACRTRSPASAARFTSTTRTATRRAGPVRA